MIAVPYHLGRRDIEVGGGPGRIAGALGQPCEFVETADKLDPVIDLNVQLANAVRSHAGAPLILAGSCNLALGALAGIQGEELAIYWFDAHGDFNTPETSPSGRLDGMALAVAKGLCLCELRARIGLDGFFQENITLIESRDLDPGEAERLECAGVRRIRLADLPDALGTGAAYVHIDLDVLSPDISPGVNCTKSGGISAEQLHTAVRGIGARTRIKAATIANYHPSRDVEDRTLRIAAELARLLIGELGLS